MTYEQLEGSLEKGPECWAQQKKAEICLNSTSPEPRKNMKDDLKKMTDILKNMGDDALNRFEENCKKAPPKFRGRYTLEDVLAEKRRRLGVHASSYDRLLEEMRRSSDNLITYPEAFSAFYPGEEWHFRRSIKKTRKSMDEILQFSVAYGKPILTVRIVQTGTRKKTWKARANIFERCRELGYSAAATPEQLEEEQLAATAALLN